MDLKFVRWVSGFFRALGIAALLLSMTLSRPGWAQTPTGAIEGEITDPSGAVIPGAKVTVTELATGRSVTLTTSAEGRFVVRNLLPGVYKVTAEAAGFAAKTLEKVSVSSGAVVNASMKLELGKTGEIISVVAEAVTVDTARQTVDSVITGTEVRNLPYFSRNFLDMAALAPGTWIRDGGSIDPTKEFAYRVVGVVGRSGTATRVQIDGIDVTDETVGTTVANFSPEAINEFQLTRSSLDPSTSFTSSGAINIITRTGGNEIHGNWFWDYYNQDMGARPHYLTRKDLEEFNGSNPPFKRNRTGGTIGGPFKKDKLFWLVNWERHYQTELRTSRVPEFPQLNISQSWPAGLRFTDHRLDWNITSNTRFFGKFHHDWNLATGGSAVSPFQTINWTNLVTFGLDHTGPRMTHTYRFGYVNFNNRIESQELKYKFLRTPQGIPYYLGVGPYAAGPNSLAPQATYQDNYQNSYEGSWFQGKHTLRYGFDVRRIILGGFANFAGPLSIYGTYDAATIAALKARGANLQDPLEYPLESFTTGNQNGFFNLAPAHGLPHGGHFNTRTAWFLQDSWKLHRNFTLNLGVRWQYDTGYFASKEVPREPDLERWGRGFSTYPEFPKDAFSPSIGFAWNVRGDNKTVIRAGFYKAYEMNILNNTMFDEFSMLPPGLGPEYYDISHVAGPDGKPINVDGKHPDGNYEDLIGTPIKNVVGLLGQIHEALNAAYANYQFDPKKGTSFFKQAQGLTYGGVIPGNQFKIPYAVQFNVGVQREIVPGTVLSVDYVHNHAIGLPNFLVDYERRRDAETLNVAAARARVNSVLGGKTVDEWIAANPTRNISAFGLISDTTYMGLYPDYIRARFFTGGFTRYRGLQVSLRGGGRSFWRIRDVGYNLSYALARGESASAVSRVEFLATPFDNRRWNWREAFGPNDLDRTHTLRWALVMTVPGGFRLNSFWQFNTAQAQNLTVPNLGGAISGANGFFGTDINGDGGRGTTPAADLLPGTKAGAFGRSIKDFKKLNQIIQSFNQNYAGKLTPHGEALVRAGIFTEAQLKRLGAVIPTIPLVPENNPWPWHNLFTTDVRLDRPIKLTRLREGMEIVPFADFYNLFNHAPANIYGGLTARFGALNYDYAAAPEGQKASDLDYARGRLNRTRQVLFGLRFNF
jgi:hypothetical protein